jgi:hypothetical protein
MTDDKITEIFLNYFYNSLNEDKKNKKNKKQKKFKVISKGAYNRNKLVFTTNKVNTLEGSKEILNDFNISSNALLKSDTSDIEKAINIISQAIKNNKDVKNIFSIKNGAILSKIDRSNAVKLIEALIKAAINTNVLQLNSNLKFETMPTKEEKLPILIRLESF